MSEDSNREAAERYFRAFERWDLAAVESLIADDAVEGRPQSGERFVGRANVMGMLHALPSEPTISWRTIRGGGRVWVARRNGPIRRGAGSSDQRHGVRGRPAGEDGRLLRRPLRARGLARAVRGRRLVNPRASSS